MRKDRSLARLFPFGQREATSRTSHVSTKGGAGAGMKLHLGCGTHVVLGWVNVDGSWNARLAGHPWLRRTVAMLRWVPAARLELPWGSSVVCHNITKPLPFAEGSVACIYSAHVLEHLYREDALALLHECYRVLEPRGILRIVVPDLHALVQKYIESRRRSDTGEKVLICAADQFNEDMRFRPASRTRGSLVYRLYTQVMDFHTHKWMYDTESLCHMLKEVGLQGATPMGLFESRIEDIRQIEQPDRVENGQGICVEAVRP
jgi:predicted SAM-dependent methyltransferase